MNTDHQPEVEVNGSNVSVVGRIDGIGDPACINISGSTMTHRNGTLDLTIRSETDRPEGRGCNQTLRYWAYHASVTIDGEMPAQVQIQHIYQNTSSGNWTVPVGRNEN